MWYYFRRSILVTLIVGLLTIAQNRFDSEPLLQGADKPTKEATPKELRNPMPKEWPAVELVEPPKRKGLFTRYFITSASLVLLCPSGCSNAKG
jgi:hypothetical protein